MTDSEHLIADIKKNASAAFTAKGVVKLYACFFQAIEALSVNRIQSHQDLSSLYELIERIDQTLLERGERPLTQAELDDLRMILNDCISVQPMHLSADRLDIARCLVVTGVLEFTSSRIMSDDEESDTDDPLCIVPWSEYIHSLRTRWTFMRTWWR